MKETSLPLTQWTLPGTLIVYVFCRFEKSYFFSHQIWQALFYGGVLFSSMIVFQYYFKKTIRIREVNLKPLGWLFYLIFVNIVWLLNDDNMVGFAVGNMHCLLLLITLIGTFSFGSDNGILNKRLYKITQVVVLFQVFFLVTNGLSLSSGLRFSGAFSSLWDAVNLEILNVFLFFNSVRVGIRPKKIEIIILICSFFLIFISGSRAAFGVVVLLSLLNLYIKLSRKIGLVLAFLTLGILGLFIGFENQFSLALGKFLNPSDERKLSESRDIPWAMGWEKFKESPWIGHGFSFKYGGYGLEDNLKIGYSWENDPHNSYLVMLDASGAIGLSLFWLLMFTIWKYRGGWNVNKSVFVTCLLYGLFCSYLVSADISFFIMLSMVFVPGKVRG